MKLVLTGNTSLRAWAGNADGENWSHCFCCGTITHLTADDQLSFKDDGELKEYSNNIGTGVTLTTFNNVAEVSDKESLRTVLECYKEFLLAGTDRLEANPHEVDNPSKSRRMLIARIRECDRWATLLVN